MGIKLIELGPFGSRIDRGTPKNLNDIPTGYIAKNMKVDVDSITVYIEPKIIKTQGST